jgi:hypothetical protein
MDIELTLARAELLENIDCARKDKRGFSVFNFREIFTDSLNWRAGCDIQAFFTEVINPLVGAGIILIKPSFLLVKGEVYANDIFFRKFYDFVYTDKEKARTLIKLVGFKELKCLVDTGEIKLDEFNHFVQKLSDYDFHETSHEETYNREWFTAGLEIRLKFTKSGKAWYETKKEVIKKLLSTKGLGLHESYRPTLYPIVFNPATGIVSQPPFNEVLQIEMKGGDGFEYKILSILFSNPGILFPYDEMNESLNFPTAKFRKNIKTHIHNLNKKISRVFGEHGVIIADSEGARLSSVCMGKKFESQE